MDDAERAARGEALARMAIRFATIKRRRSPVEPPRELTDAYVTLVVACGFARLGDTARVTSAIAAARAVLSPLHDPIHDFLLDAYVARATDDRAALEALTARHAALDRVSRYKIERMLEWSILLDPTRTGRAIEGFQSKLLQPISLTAPAAVMVVRRENLARAREPADVEACVAALLPREITDGIIELLDDFAIAFAAMPFRDVRGWTERLAETWWPQLSDSWGTDSHFCLSAVGGADALVRCLVGP